MKIRKISILLLFIFFLNACSGASDIFNDKKRSEKSDEFLVEKKKPLTEPPDINELPVPLDQENQGIEDEEINIKKALNIDESKNVILENNSDEQKNLEETILEKINN